MKKEKHKRMTIDDNVAIEYEKKQTNNRRKGMKLISTWLSEEEVKDLKIIFTDLAKSKDKTFWSRSIGLLFIEAFKRGDLKL